MTNKINDIDLKNWKQYPDIISDSLWLIDKRDNTGAHKGDYHGNFIPQIPNQLLQRYTKKDDWIIDPFVGSGTTMIECQKLGRNAIGIDLDKEIIETAKERTLSENGNSKFEFINANSMNVNIEETLRKNNIEKVQFVIFHPPYWDIIKFNDLEGNLANAKTLEEFLDMFTEVEDNMLKYLEKNRYFAIVIGDIYKKSEWIPLNSFITMQNIKKGYKLKSIVVKNINETKGKQNQKAIWRYRSLAGGFYVFKHEYILIFKKVTN